MKILIVGGGGREHALAWKCAQSTRVTSVFVAPGNAGTKLEHKVSNVDIPADDVDSLCSFAADNNIDLTIVGPEAALVAGIVDRFMAEGLRCFGPTMAAARLEGSKSFAKDFLSRHGIATARYETFRDLNSAEHHVGQCDYPVVIKADGLAAGKGVTVAIDQQQAMGAVGDCLRHGRFGAAGESVVVEEFLEGEEASFICMVGGEHILALASSQDHKARDDGDRGPNTGGMGAYSPAPVVTDDLHEKIMGQIIRPTVAGLAQEGMPYSGFLYAGLMILPDGQIKVLEYNCRLGDPETQPVLMRMKSDLVELCLMSLEGDLRGAQVEWDPRAALGVVMAAEGYPGAFEMDRVITGLDTVDSSDTKAFHAGTRMAGKDIVTSGGRVLCVTALGESTHDAQKAAYDAVNRIHWEGAYYRTDIGYRAIAREA